MQKMLAAAFLFALISDHVGVVRPAYAQGLGEGVYFYVIENVETNRDES